MSSFTSIFKLENITDKRRIQLLIKIIVVSLIAENLLTWKAWIPYQREFPLISAFESLQFSLELIGDIVLTSILLVTLLLVFFKKRIKVSIILFITGLSLLILEDITRLQPWTYYQSLTLLLLSFHNQKIYKAILFGVIMIVSGTYFWSGIQKLNINFITEIMPRLLSKPFNFQLQPNVNLPFTHYLFFLIPITEIFVGLSLLFKRFRNYGIILGVTIHLLILLILGPLGHNWNNVVWIWNISLIASLVLFINLDLDFKKKFQSFKYNYIVLSIFFIMPFLNFAGYWDNNLSGALYSGTKPNMIYYFEKSIKKELTPNRRLSTYHNEENSRTYISTWAYKDINTVPYPEERYYRRIAKTLCKESTDTNSGSIIYSKENFTSKLEEKKYECNRSN